MTRKQVVDTAFELVASDGIDALSMPRLARALGVGPMTIYTYVANKEELLIALMGRARVEVLATVAEATSSEWPDVVLDRFRRVRTFILGQPGIGWLLIASGREIGQDPEGRVFELMESILDGIVRAGISPDDAGRLLESLSQYTIGFALREAARREADERKGSQAHWESALRALDSARFPILTSVVDVLLTSASTDQFEFGLRVIINGVARKPRAARRPRRS